ncbi:hypothetical protein Maes01_00124 [Microbulbifer aestuariivivens]|uniref:DUF411 domain-containing protein n=1 Tax=Microbulbifer aestuariivivens TaxID=1908308 RepID=A0ABP9WK58_9GAMM
MRYILLKCTEPARRLLSLSLSALLVLLPPGHAIGAEADQAAAQKVTFTEADMTVFKHRLCFCCKDWIKHLQRAGMNPAIINRRDMATVKSQWAIPEGFGSCHTAVWRDRYVFEGHIPARIIRQFLSRPPQNAIGLSVPGMPKGSPGMYKGGDFEPYNVYVLLLGGDYRLYARLSQAEVDSEIEAKTDDLAQQKEGGG